MNYKQWVGYIELGKLGISTNLHLPTLLFMQVEVPFLEWLCLFAQTTSICIHIYNVCQKSLEHPYSVRTFPPPSHFRCRNGNCEPLPPSCNVELIAEAFSYLEKHYFSLQCYSYHLQTTLLYGGGDFVVRLQYKSQEVLQDF